MEVGQAGDSVRGESLVWKGRPCLDAMVAAERGKPLWMKKSPLSERLPGLIGALLSVMGLMVLR